MTPLNMDFSAAIAIQPSGQQWVTSPADGVSRTHLERVASEPGHTTSLVVLSPHEFQAQHTALVYWPANEKFQPHQH